MTAGDVKIELDKARKSIRAYQLARDKANAYKQLLMCSKGVKYDNNCGTHEHKGNSVENAYCTLADYENEAERLLQEMINARQAAENFISDAPNQDQREVLTRRYIIGQKWEDVAICMNYSLRRIYQLHGYALQNIALNCTIYL